jgi:WD40 repeat protein
VPSFRTAVTTIFCVAILVASPSDLRSAPEPGSEKGAVDLDGLPLPEGARAVLGTTRFRHPGSVTWLSALDDKHLLSLCSDGHIRVWDAETGRQLKQFLPKSDYLRVSVAALSPDRKTLATGGTDFFLRLWDTTTGKEIRQFPAARLALPVQMLTFSPDGKTLATYTYDRIVRLWDLAEGKELKQIKLSPADAGSPAIGYQGAQIAFTPDGKSLAVVDDWVLRIFDVEEGKEQRLLGGHTGPISAVSVVPDGSGIVSIARDRTARVWDSTTGKTMAKLSLGAAGGRSLTVSPDGKTVAAITSDRNVRLFELPSGKPLSQIETPIAFSDALTFSVDGKTVYAGGPDPFIRPYDVATGKSVFPSRGHLSAILTMNFAPDGKRLVTTGSDREMIVWEAATGKLLRSVPQWRDYEPRVTTLQFAPDGKSVLSAGFDRTYRRWDLDKGEPSAEFVFTPVAFTASAISPNGQILASVGSDRKVRICDLKAEKELTRIEFKTETPDGFQIAPSVLAIGDERSLIGLMNDRTLRRWNLKTGQETDRFGPLIFTSTSSHFGLSADGRMAVISLNNVPNLLEMSTGKSRQLFAPQPINPSEPRVALGTTAAALSPDGKTVATAHPDGTLRFWDCRTAKQLTVRTGLLYTSQLVFSPDQKSLAALASNGLVTVWDVPGGDDPGRTRPDTLSAEMANEQWELLSNDDAPKAFQAVLSLAGSPKETLPIARRLLKAQPVATEKEIVKLIDELDADDFEMREKATRKLIGLGKAAEQAVRKALTKNPTPEAAMRLDQILKKSSGGTVHHPEVAHAVRAVEVLERIGTSEAQAVLEVVAKGPESARLTSEAQAALERMRKK